MEYGKRIKAIRNSKGIKAIFVAEKLGITPGAYSDLESGRRRITLERAERIADILGVDISVFFDNKLSNPLNKTGTNG